MKARMFAAAALLCGLYLSDCNAGTPVSFRTLDRLIHHAAPIEAGEPVSFAALDQLVSDTAPVESGEPVSFSAMDPLCQGCIKGDGCDCGDTCTCGADCECGKEKAKPAPKEPEPNPAPPEQSIDEPAHVEQPKPFVRSPHYPLRDPRTYWTHPGVSNRAKLIEHLTSGQHAGKFDPTWLAGLSDAELESLHSDDHDGRLAAHVQKQPEPNPPPPPAPLVERSTKPEGGLTVVELDGRRAVYRMEVINRPVTKTRKQCNGRRCWVEQYTENEQTVKPVFLRWE